jgi:hypothetical protein
VRVVLAGLALVVGAVSGAAGTLLHQHWWGLALALAAGLASISWLPPGGVRLAFAVGWCLCVARAAVESPGGGFLISTGPAGLSWIAASLVLLVAALVTVGGGRTHAADRGVRGNPT